MISSAVTISSRRHPCCGSSGICSMKRRCSPSPIAQRSRSAASWSLTRQQDAIDLHRFEFGQLRGPDSRKRVHESVAVGHRLERLTVQRCRG